MLPDYFSEDVPRFFRPRFSPLTRFPSFLLWYSATRFRFVKIYCPRYAGAVILLLHVTKKGLHGMHVWSNSEGCLDCVLYCKTGV